MSGKRQGISNDFLDYLAEGKNFYHLIYEFLSCGFVPNCDVK